MPKKIIQGTDKTTFLWKNSYKISLSFMKNTQTSLSYAKKKLDSASVFQRGSNKPESEGVYKLLKKNPESLETLIK